MEKRYVGLKMIAKHILKPKNNATSVELVMIYEGILAKLFYSLTWSLTSQYLTMEINGLKSKCEKVSLLSRDALKFLN